MCEISGDWYGARIGCVVMENDGINEYRCLGGYVINLPNGNKHMDYQL